MIKNLLALFVLSVLVFATVGLGFYLVGSPLETRGLKFDALRLQDIGKIKIGIEDYYRDNKKMPVSADQLLEKSTSLVDKPYLEKLPRDPKMSTAYEYKDLGSGKYQICADFETSTEAIEERKTGVDQSPSPLSNLYAYGSETRLHPKGNYCYEYSIPQYSDGTGAAGQLILLPPVAAEPPKNTLIVTSNISGVPMTGTQADTGGTTNYTLAMTSEIITTITAPSTSNGQKFTGWSGCNAVGNQCFAVVTGGATYTVTAYYAAP